MAKQRYLDLEGLKLNNQLMEAEMAEADAKVLEDAKAYADGKDEAITEAKKAGTDAQTDVDALEEKVGEVAEGKTVVEMIADAQNAATYDDTQVKADIAANTKAIADEVARADAAEKANKALIEANAGEIATLKEKDTAIESRVKTNEDAIAVLNGDGEGSVKKTVDEAINEFATNVTDDAVVNSYKELIDWVAEHGSEAAEMAAGIEANKTDIAELETLVGTLPEGTTAKTVVELIRTLVDAEKVRAEGVEGGLDTRLQTIEEAIGEGGSVGAQIDAKIAELDADVVSATVEEGKGVQVQVTEVDGKVTTVAVTGNYDNSYDVKGSANTAEVNAKAYADGLAVNYDAAGSANAAQTNAQNYTDGKVAETNENVTANATAITALEEKVGDGYEAITPEEIQGLFTTTA